MHKFIEIEFTESEYFSDCKVISGVEDKTQLEYIRKINCYFVQGVVFDKPPAGK